MRVRHLAILGLGLLGGSLGLAVKRALSDCIVSGYAHRKETLDSALAIGAIDKGHIEARDAVGGAELVVLCTPVLMLSPLLGQIGGTLADGAVVTDVGSTKRSIVRDAQAILRPGVHFVGSHPMAGSEKRGIQFARPDLYEGALCITTPTPATDPAALETVEAFWRALGMRITHLDPVRHDELLAEVSHLPHAVAAALVSMQQDDALDVCGKGFLDLTRIAGGDGGLWRDIFLDNRAGVRQSISRLIDELNWLDDLLEKGNPDDLKRWLDTAAARRQALSERRESGSSTV